MNPILSGIDCEYGILIEGRGAKTQVEDSQSLVRSYPDQALRYCWDYRFENPRNDLRGFELKHLAVDPNDAAFDEGKSYGNSIEIRSDLALPNGARFYNDHGHPEYATPESFSIFELAKLDEAGHQTVQAAAEAYQFATEVYKNNTDYHGASYGTHESYLLPRSLAFDCIYDRLLPMLIVRQILTGAGKVGSETKEPAHFQLSQRADFFVEPANAETLWRRPIFNTRDEPHGAPDKFIRLHVISGDANMNPVSTALKVGLVKLALNCPETHWDIKDPVRTFQQISRDHQWKFEIPLKAGWTTAYEIFEGYFAEYEARQINDPELNWVVATARELLNDLNSNFDRFRRKVDWASKLHLFDQLRAEVGLDWGDPSLQSYDLEYSNIDPEKGLYFALKEMGEIDSELPELKTPKSRAFARGLAVERFAGEITRIGWRGITFGEQFIELSPSAAYPESLAEISDVGTFISILKEIQ